ncbi:MAG: DNA gyrase inhibitor YacG [Pseudomonadota bacterium]
MSCPICGDRTAQAWRPFCSRRCADIDLARWLGGGYALPGKDCDAEEGHPPPATGSDQKD